MKRISVFLVIVLIGIAVGAAGSWAIANNPDWLPGFLARKQQKKNEDNVKYVGPMHPRIVRDEPGNCPICGMELVPKKVDDSGDPVKSEGQSMNMTADSEHGEESSGFQPGDIRIDPVVVNNIGVRTARVQERDLSRTFHTVGDVTYNERLVSHMHTRVNGWVEKLFLDAEGDRVQKGDPVLKIYSPELVTAQDEFLLALKKKRQMKERSALGQNDRGMVRQARERLLSYGLSEREIEEIARTGEYQSTILLRAQQNGVVTDLGVREGMRVTPKDKLYTVADLSKVWVQARAYAPHAAWADEGDKVNIEMPYIPDETWEGEIERVYPYLEEKSRTVKLRVLVANPERRLKPNMFAKATVYADTIQNAIVVPRQALIRTGKKQIVILALGQGRFRPREVVAGIESGQWVQIKKGLREGQRVVTRSQFLLDSESDLKASLERMDAGDSGENNATSASSNASMDHSNH